MTLPLIIQIQQAALDGQASVTDALRKAKLACAKLGLTEFGRWVDSELEGYMEVVVDYLPGYRKVTGTAEAYNPYHGWQPLIFPNEKVAEICSFAPIGMSIPAVEESLRDANSSGGFFEFPYPPSLANQIRQAMGSGGANIRLKIGTPTVGNIVNAVRNILLEWTIKMEREGVLGNDLVFNESEREKSSAATAQTVNNFQIGSVATLVQHAEGSIVQGGINSTFDIAQGVRDLLEQLDRALPKSDPIHQEVAPTLTELRAASNTPVPDTGRIRRGLESLKHVMEHATGHLVASGALTLIEKLLQHFN
jgi:AbiTii